MKLKESKQEYLNLAARWRTKVADVELVVLGIHS
jgi:hypothetical protein